MINKRYFKTKDEVEVTFELEVPESSSKVSIVADFLDWQPEPMKKIAKSSMFKFKTRLPKDGEFQFRYLLDGQQWVNDPNADNYIPNGFGEDNSLVSTY
ncbi:isoamylase early set domain-containing protein [Vibrio sp.]|uniref:1,4-alpha-glucan branching protein n=1 Tax=Vibrio viridaestus TaxID=2487322 RepID=A0A3N9TKI9_9VIBR|nr:isoamylase early set domain-containing protein [Vibrio viridaestus]MDC0611948.1 isoamylase early set domain-containing protein [Vibrio sp.]RQW64908.1 1,4-alpha-glucan branching protein [Vibrio viridaestus]